MYMRAPAWLFVTLLLPIAAFADDEEDSQPHEIQAHVHDNAVPSLVNLSALPSCTVNGCVNVISGDLCEQGTDDIVSGSDPYILGHNYCSSSLDEGNLGDSWNFMHHHLIIESLIMLMYQGREITRVT
jgi:hypothetical protein